MAARGMVKVKKVQAPDFSRMVDDIMSGKRTGRAGAEAAGFRALTALIQVYLMGEGTLADSLRELVSALMKRDDPLRKDIPEELWAALWPTFNTLTHARKKAAEHLTRAAASVTPREETHERNEQEGVDAGAGILRAADGGAQ